MSDATFAWDDQRAFLAVLDTGSLSAAARTLGLTQPTVRHRIEALERAIGQPLFIRGVNGLAPTPEARGLAGHVRRMAHASEAFRREAKGAASEVGGPVRLSVSDFIGIEVVPPMLAALRERHPRLVVELLLTNANTDLPGQEADVAVRMARPSQNSLVARHVGRIPLGFFASPAYLDRNGVPETVADLTRHAMVGPDRMPAYIAVLDALGREAGGPLPIALRSDSHPAQLAAIRVGLGIGVVQVPVGERDLVRVLPERVVFDLDTWIVAHEDVRRSARIDAVFNHLVEAFQAYCSRQHARRQGEGYDELADHGALLGRPA